MIGLRLPLCGERVCIEPGADGAARLVRRVDGAPAGRLRLELAGDTLIIRELSVEPALRGYGLGSEAARLVREEAAAAGVRTLRAWAAPHLGLSVYFWIRMGLHPLHGPGPDGGIWFERTLPTPATRAPTSAPSDRQ